MSFIEWLTGRARPKRLLSTAPGPSPWYLLRGGPALRSSHGALNWVAAPDDAVAAGKVHLVDATGATRLVLDFYCYVQALERRRLLIWTVRPIKQRDGVVLESEVVLSILAIDELQPLTDLGAIHATLKERAGFAHDGGLVAEKRVSTDLPAGQHRLDFPPEFDELDELLLLVHSTAGGLVGNAYDRMHLTLWELRPRERSLEILPQDWFNSGAFDFGYQWPARVARDPTTRRIVGEGVRIPYFELDDSRRHVSRWWK